MRIETVDGSMAELVDALDLISRVNCYNKSFGSNIETMIGLYPILPTIQYPVMGVRVRLPFGLQTNLKCLIIMNNVYFGNEGMTSTTGSHYANIAKEMIKRTEKQLYGVKF